MVIQACHVWTYHCQWIPVTIYLPPLLTQGCAFHISGVLAPSCLTSNPFAAKSQSHSSMSAANSDSEGKAESFVLESALKHIAFFSLNNLLNLPAHNQIYAIKSFASSLSTSS